MASIKFWVAAIMILLFGFVLYPMLQPYLTQQQFASALATRMSNQTIALNRYEKSNTEINQILNDLLGKVPAAARVTIAIIKPPATPDNIGSGLKYDMTHGVARPGRLIGDLTTDLPIAELNDLLTDLLTHKCARKRVEELTSINVIDRYKKMGVTSIYACGVFNTSSQMLGVIFMTWDNNTPVPNDNEISHISQLMIETANAIGAQSIK